MTPDSLLPLGYFISRLAAHKVAQTGQSENYLDILSKFINDFKEKPNFVYDLFLAIAEDSGLNQSDNINMKGISASGLESWWTKLLINTCSLSRIGIRTATKLIQPSLHWAIPSLVYQMPPIEFT